ncbi:MAG: hypothetical protein RMX68_017225 [Aulosira sp. ZfuVER01]|nr:hypothetical protein [Aulosira sp. ZfuVER01]MDZ7997334.1 hypothetical protein [Aulosira sp. DedVER01a]MDZ8054167.1 hypothetical protein [Aulosira sp. ZfuCHP01]
MAKPTEVKTTEASAQELSTEQDTTTVQDSAEPVEVTQDIDEILNSLKSLLSALEKLQKARQEVGEIKPLIGRMLDGEVVAGEELEQLKSGISGLLRLVRAYSDHQTALAKAQSARDFLDQVLK